MTSLPSSYGGLIYTLDSSLRADIETLIHDFTEKTDKATSFKSTITEKIAPEYSRFVPIGMSIRRILRRLKIHHIKSSKHNSDAEDPTENHDLKDGNSCYYRSIGAILSDISDLYQNCLLYNE